MRFGALSLALVLACAARSAHGAPRHSSACLAGLAPVLVEGNFSGSVDCKRDHLMVRLVGQIVSGGHEFAIYDYHYRLRPVCPACAVHGGQRIIFLRDGRYIGQYKPESVRVSISTGVMMLTPMGDLELPLKLRTPISVPISTDCPPPTFWVGGENLEFFR